MTITQEAREQEVARALKAIGHIATLPEVTVKIIDLVEDPASTAEDLRAVIARDPALCARILKVVNSPFYGLTATIASVERAIVVLGFSAIKNISIAASMSRLFRGELSPTFGARMLWNHCNAVAMAAKLLSDRLGLGHGEEAYLAGLLHDIGIVVELQYDSDRLLEALTACGADAEGHATQTLILAEESKLGANHQDFGAGLCESWRFPPSLVAAAKFHHDPMSAPEESRELTAVVHAADCLASMLEPSLRIELESSEIHAEVRQHLGLTDETIATLLDDLGRALAVEQAES